MQPEETQPEETQAEKAQAEETQTEKAQEKTLSPEDIQKEAQKIAEILGETDEQPLGQIAQVIEKCGLELVQKVTEETNKIEEKGGMKTHDGKRRRTKGGVFFFIIKGRMDADVRQEIFPNFGKHSNGDAAPPGIKWEERLEHYKPLLEEPGQVKNLTVTLIGRPGKLHIENGSVMTVIEQKEVKAPPYPKGVPDFDEVEKITYYYVFMSLRHWEKIAESLEDETDMMIVEGTSVYDPEIEGISLLTTSTTTKLLERQKRLSAAQEAEKQKKAKQPKKSDNKKSDSKKSNTKAESKAPKSKPAPPKELGNVPASVADKLKQLHSAAETLRQKIETMEEQGKKTGLNMTRRLLEQTEKQITALEKQYEK